MSLPLEALDLPALPNTDEFRTTFRELIRAVAGDRPPSDVRDAAVHLVKWLRANPADADLLLGRGGAR